MILTKPSYTWLKQKAASVEIQKKPANAGFFDS